LTDKWADVDMYSEEIEKNICSKFFKPDYGIMHFVVLENSEKSYKVLSSYSSEKYLPKTKDYGFKTWNDYILESFGVRRLLENTNTVEESNLLRATPSDNSQSIRIPEGHEMFCTIEIQGDWVKVKYDCFYNQVDKPHEGQPC